MTQRRIELLVLDAHGVVLTNPFFAFLEQLARATSQSSDEVQQRWRSELRTPAWTGELAEDKLWQRLTGSENGRHWREVLEAAYELGPAAPHLQRWSRQVPIWLLSNHRSPWLLPRLERFGIKEFFERVVISDVIGAAKPEPAAYVDILERTTSPASALFVDDQDRNVAAAAKIGLTAFHAGADLSWIAAVDDALYRNAIPP
jgi:FMN phosphatase YigB (HAD superfamily)